MKVPISTIEINPSGELHVTPSEGRFEFIYRSAMEVHWRPETGSLFFPPPKEWSYARCFEQIVNAVRQEYGVRLEISPRTNWINVPEEARQAMIGISSP